MYVLGWYKFKCLNVLYIPPSFLTFHISLIFIIEHSCKEEMFEIKIFRKILMKIFCQVTYFFIGISYLHNEAPFKIIHRDLKSKNGESQIILHKRILSLPKTVNFFFVSRLR